MRYDAETVGWYLDGASNAAEHSDCWQHQVGAVIDTKLPIYGCNIRKTHPKFPTRSIHAEMKVLLECARRGVRTRGRTMFVSRPSASGVRRMSKPCSSCMHFLKEAGIVGVYYTDPAESAGVGYVAIA